MGKVVFCQAAFQEGAGIHTRRAVRLEEHEVAAMTRRFVARMKEMVEPHLEQIGRAGIAGDVPTQLAIRAVRARHHGQRIPTHQGRQLFLNSQIAGERRLLVHRDGVDIGRDQLGLPAHLRRARHHGQLVQHIARPRRAVRGHQRGEGVAPFGGFARVNVDAVAGEEAGDAVVGHASTVGRCSQNMVSKMPLHPIRTE
jgi:hypothetical protein